MIPKRIFFNFGFSEDFGKRPFHLIHYLAVKSAKLVNQCEVTLYYEYAPQGNMWWEKALEYCTAVQCKAPRSIYGNELEHPAYRSDVFRLTTLNEQGGIYLDIDTICIEPLDHLLKHQFVMGREEVDGHLYGLCNGVMMAEPNTEFGKRWIENYQDYDPRWGVMQVWRPWWLAQKSPELIHVEPPATFFKYGWSYTDLQKIYEQDLDMSGACVLHLWESKSWDNFLWLLTPGRIHCDNTTYNRLARRFL